MTEQGPATTRLTIPASADMMPPGTMPLGTMPPSSGMMPPGMMLPSAGMMPPGTMPPSSGMMRPGTHPGGAGRYYPPPPENEDDVATSFHGHEHHPSVMNELLEAALHTSSRSMPPPTDVYGQPMALEEPEGENYANEGIAEAEKKRKAEASSEWVWTKEGAVYMDEVWGMRAKEDAAVDEEATTCLEANVKNGMDGAKKAGYIKGRNESDDDKKDCIAEDMKAFYGTLARPKSFKVTGKTYLIFQPLILVQCIFNPLWTFFLAFVISTQVRYRTLWLTIGLQLLLLVSIVLANFSRYTPETKEREKRLFKFFLCSNMFAAILGIALGESTYQANFKPYYDLRNLAHYPSCDPSVHKAQMFSDAGQIDFFYGSHLDIARSFGFKSGDTYCVAPIVGPETGGWATGGIMPKLDNYDFWAVGVNCCSGHAPDFHCGEWSNWRASSGLRLTRDDLRDYFRLAVQGARAEHNLRADEPFFVFLMENPQAEVDAYFVDGWMELAHGIVGLLFIQAMVTGAMGLLYIDRSS